MLTNSLECDLYQFSRYSIESYPPPPTFDEIYGGGAQAALKPVLPVEADPAAPPPHVVSC